MDDISHGSRNADDRYLYLYDIDSPNYIYVKWDEDEDAARTIALTMWVQEADGTPRVLAFATNVSEAAVFPLWFQPNHPARRHYSLGPFYGLMLFLEGRCVEGVAFLRA